MARKSASGDKRSPQCDELLWLETYFIVFPQEQRPTLVQVERALSDADPRLQLKNLAADDDGFFASLLVESPEDRAAVEVSYEVGDAVVEQNLEWAKQLRKRLTSNQLQRLMAADARLEVAHFERLQAPPLRQPSASAADAEPERARDDASFGAADDDYDGDDFDADAALEVFDPTCLLTVVDALSKLTNGMAFDPAAGEVV